MLNSLAILAVLLAAQVTSGHGSSKANHDGNGGNRPATPSVAVCDPDKPPKEQPRACQVAPDNTEQRVKLTDIPPISMVKTPKDWLDHVFDWGPWVFNFLLVIVGGAAGYFAWRTLGAIHRQADLMKQSADISRGATVPTLRILNFKMGGSDPLIDHEMELTVRNYGATPAILDALYISFDDGERWPTGEGESVSYSEPGGRAVAANSEVVLQSSPYICLVSPVLIDRFRREHKSIYAHVRLKYLDVFESPAKTLNFSVHLNERQNGTISCKITGQWNGYDKPQKAK